MIGSDVLQHRPVLLSPAASMASGLARWTIHTWSSASTDTPMVWPSCQPFGRGLGHAGSTSNRGAITLPAACAIAVFVARFWPTPSTVNTATSADPISTLRFMFWFLSMIASTYFAGTVGAAGMDAAAAVAGVNFWTRLA